MILTKKEFRKIFVFELILIIFNGIFIDFFHIPSIIKYIPDVFNILLFICIYKGRTIIKLTEKTDKIIFMFILWSTVTAILNLVSPILFLWEMRNFGRAFVIYYITINLLDKNDCEKIYRLLKKIVVLNFIITLYQYFILNISQDFLGGIFGCQTGVNSASNIFLCIVFIWTIIKYLQKEENSFWMLIVIGSSLIIAALAELKIFFIEFIIIIILSIVLIKPSKKTFFIIFFSIIGLLVGLNLLKHIFPVHYETLMNITQLTDYADMNAGGYGISRINMINDVNEKFLNDNYIARIIGLGMGNCTMSSNFSFLTSDFYSAFGHYNYNWFSHTMLYLQTGIIGLFIYFYIFISIIEKSLYRIIVKKEKNLYYFINTIFSIILIINILYNHWTRDDTCYLAYFMLAVAYIGAKKR